MANNSRMNIAVNIAAYAPYVNESSRATWERENNAIIQEVAPNNSLVPATQRPYYISMQWEYPRSDLVIGFDIASDPVRARKYPSAILFLK